MLFTEIIKDNKSFSRCYKAGYVSCRMLTCYYRKNKLPYNRIGITAGKKIGCAVERNRAKRIIRTAYRLSEKDFPIGYDLVFVARDNIGGKKTNDIMQFFYSRVISDINKNALKQLSQENHKGRSENGRNKKYTAKTDASAKQE